MNYYFSQDYLLLLFLQVMRRKRSSMLHIFKEFSRLFKRKKNMTLETPQRFYPQCTRCSVKQLSYLSAVSRGLRAPSPVVNHFTSLRLCHIFLPFPLLVVSAYRFCAVREQVNAVTQNDDSALSFNQDEDFDPLTRTISNTGINQ